MRLRAIENRRINRLAFRVMLGNGPSRHKLAFNIRKKVGGFPAHRSILPYERFLDNRTGWYD